MQTPEYVFQLPDWPDVDDFVDVAEIDNYKQYAINAAEDISKWFIHVQDRTPKLRLIRMDAIKFLRDTGMSKQEIAAVTGISEHRINEVIKEQRARA